ncbi:MAG: S8 family serine peptidase [Candidatus Marinimicrobia bacterium]|nr:S8 family serine peptidase [Candidatus Neomarinimicrobiota bacterium]MBL7009682.1 S8 family serine peptidase [Candidatus Neomarinimicrobiota bacterium]MBL7029575.1 S8 family serine peptidase [Candidatus Neomarinimicrobiota bacterium]
MRDVRGRFAGGFYELEIPDELNPFEVGKKLLNSGEFDHVYMNTYSKISTVIPDDSLYLLGEHWNLDKIKMAEAWDITTGSSNVIVAVIDQGIEINHPDLDNNIWTNTGYCFTDDCDSNPGNYYHGTAVAGIIAANLNNGIGVSGMAGGWDIPGVKLMSLKVDINGDIDDAAAAAAIDYAVLNGARIINCSFGKEKDGPIVVSLDNAINNAVNTDTVLVVFSSGNRTSLSFPTSIHWPANKSNVFTVGATIESDYRKTFNDATGEGWGSKYGFELDVVAPGIHIPTTDIVGSAGNTSTSYNLNFNGTSAAAPHVSALAALMLSAVPTLSSADIIYFIKHTADTFSWMVGNYEYGSGRINAKEAILSLIPSAPTGLYIVNPYNIGDPVSISWTASSRAVSYKIWRKCKYGMYNIDCSLQVIGSTTSPLFTDPEVEIAFNDGATDLFTYYVSGVNSVGESAKSSPAFTWGESFIKRRDEIADVGNPIPEAFALEPNYPNPFNPLTMIKYSLPEASSVSLDIYDLLGSEIFGWSNNREDAGYKRITWNGKDQKGNSVPAGIYIYKLTAKSHESGQVFTENRKMVLLK